MKAIDKKRFDVWARIIEGDKRTSDVEKASLKIKAWATVASSKNFFSILVELGRIY
jgi:hypothetical protein